jgi:hypothetical protein
MSGNGPGMMMKFAQRQVGTAQGWWNVCLGKAPSPSRVSMPRRATPLIAVLAVLLIPAGAHASDPLLSGYAGPGAGEQVVLGGATAGGKGGGSDTPSGGAGAASSGASAATRPAQDQSLRAPATVTPAPSAAESQGATPALTRKPQRRKPSSSSSKHQADAGTSANTTTTTAATLPGAPEVVAYPTHAGAVSGLPLSAGGVLLVVLGLAGLILVVLGLRRLVAPAEYPPSPPQVPGI